jgi:hypothetical protein
MIDLNEDNDPLLFRVQIPSGALIVQWTEVCAAAQPTSDAAPNMQSLAAAVRKVSRTPDVAAQATDEVLVAVCERIARAIKTSGN